MRDILTIILLIFGIVIFMLGVMLLMMSEQIMKSIQLCWSPECSKEFIDTLWRSVTYLLIGIVNMLLGVALIALAIADVCSC